MNVSHTWRGFFPKYKRQGHGQQNTDLLPRPRMSGTSTAQLKLRTLCARCGKVGHWVSEYRRGFMFFFETRFYFCGASVGLTVMLGESL